VTRCSYEVAIQVKTMEFIFQFLNATVWCLAALGFWMFVDCVRNEPDREDRVVWAVLLLFLPPLFGPIYLVQRYRPRKRTAEAVGESVPR
jgi:hypothetical protein